MKQLLIMLVTMACAASLRADDFFTNGDFSNGSTGWEGSFQVFESGNANAPKGLVIQLQPHEWTWLSQVISPHNQRMKFEIKYELAPDTVLSSDHNDYRGIGANVGDPVRAIHVPVTGVGFILETNVDQKRRTTLPFMLKTGTRRSETVFDSAKNPQDYLDEGPAETVTIALPPGTGTITLGGISGTGVDPLAPSPTLTPRPPGPPQDTYTQNSDFSQGTVGWAGSFTVAPPPTAPAPATPPSTTPGGGLVIQLKPHEWTTLTQEIDIKSYRMTLHCQVLFGKDVIFSTDQADSQNIQQKVGLPDWSQAIKILTGMAQGSMEGEGFVVLTGQDKSENEFFAYKPQWGYERTQRANFSFGFGVPENKRSLMVALPPGTGTVTIQSITANGASTDTNPEAAPPGRIGNWAVTQVPTAPADDLIKNGDFSNGLTGWKGDLHPYAELPAQTDITLPTAPEQGTGAYLELRKSDWVKVSQDIDVTTPWIKVSIIYAYSSDVTFTTFPSDFENIFASVGLDGSESGVPGSGSYFLENLSNRCSVYSIFNPARRETSMRMDTIPMEEASPDPAKKRFTFGLPPGKGFVIIYQISIEPCAESPVGPSTTVIPPSHASQ